MEVFIKSLVRGFLIGVVVLVVWQILDVVSGHTDHEVAYYITVFFAGAAGATAADHLWRKDHDQ